LVSNGIDNDYNMVNTWYRIVSKYAVLPTTINGLLCIQK